MSHITLRQQILAQTDKCAIVGAHHTPTQIPPPKYTPYTEWPPPPGVWAEPTLGQAEMISNNEGRKCSNQRQNRKNSALTRVKTPDLIDFSPAQTHGFKDCLYLL